MPGQEISPAAYFIGTVLFVVISSFINQKNTSRKINANNQKTASAAKEIDDTVTNLNTQIGDLKKDIEDVKAERNNANEQIGKLKTEINELKAQINRLETANKEALQKADTLAGERDSEIRKNAELLQKYSDANQTIATQEREIRELERRVTELEKQIAVAKTVDEIATSIANKLTTVLHPIVPPEVKPT